MSTVEECGNIVLRYIVHLIGHAIRIRRVDFFVSKLIRKGRVSVRGTTRREKVGWKVQRRCQGKKEAYFRAIAGRRRSLEYASTGVVNSRYDYNNRRHE